MRLISSSPVSGRSLFSRKPVDVGDEREHCAECQNDVKKRRDFYRHPHCVFPPNTKPNPTLSAHLSSCRVPLVWRRQIVFEPPGVAVLLQLMNDVVSNAKPLCLVEFIAVSHEPICGRLLMQRPRPEHLPARPHGLNQRTKREHCQLEGAKSLWPNIYRCCVKMDQLLNATRSKPACDQHRRRRRSSAAARASLAVCACRTGLASCNWGQPAAAPANPC
jgi:hypothetical protein